MTDNPHRIAIINTPRVEDELVEAQTTITTLTNANEQLHEALEQIWMMDRWAEHINDAIRVATIALGRRYTP